MKSPYNITLSDQITAVEERIKWMQWSYPPKVNQGEMTGWSATHKIETEKAILKNLKAKQPRQIKIF